MKYTYSGEVWGARLEVAGLIFLLAAALWQAKVSDWFGWNERQALTYSQGEVNSSVLISLDELAQLARSDKATDRDYFADNIHKRAVWARDIQRETMSSLADLKQRQGDALNWVRMALFVSGAGLVIVGKAGTTSFKGSKERTEQDRKEREREKSE